MRTVSVEGFYLYREKYVINVFVRMYDHPGYEVKNSDVINSFDELVKCAKEVVDKMELH